MAAEAVLHASEAEGVEGNVHASRAWKGNDWMRRQPAGLVSFLCTSPNSFGFRADHIDAR